MSQIPYPQWPQEIPPERLLVLASELDGSVEATHLRLHDKRRRLLEAGVLFPSLDPTLGGPLRLQMQEDGGSCPGGGGGAGGRDCTLARAMFLAFYEEAMSNAT